MPDLSESGQASDEKGDHSSTGHPAFVSLRFLRGLGDVPEVCEQHAAVPSGEGMEEHRSGSESGHDGQLDDRDYERLAEATGESTA
ncbi:hypothetical protein D3C78_1380270 [compost metagenome]